MIKTLFIVTILKAGSIHSQIDSTKFQKSYSSDLVQPDTTLVLKKNTIFAEIGGNSFIYSINYDRLFDVSKRFKISSRIGVHYTHYAPLQYYKTLSIPFEISGLYSIFRSKHFVELGSGLSYLSSYDRITDHEENIIILALRLGYRYQNPNGGLFVKIGFVPLYDWIVMNPDPSVPHHTWFLSVGLGLGYTF